MSNGTLDRHPKDSKWYDIIMAISKTWEKTGNWRQRQKLRELAEKVNEESFSLCTNNGSEPVPEDSLYSAECVVDLATACENFLKEYKKHTGAGL